MYQFQLYDLDLHVYSKFYVAAQKAGVVWTLYSWAIKQGLFKEEDLLKDDHPYCEWADNFEHADAVQTVLAYEIAYFVFRRLNGTWGEMVDFFYHERNRFTNEYREKTGYQIVGNDVDLN